MADVTLEFKFRVGGALTNATSVVLSSADGTYGAKRTDTNAVVVADGTAMTNASTGVYRYTFAPPAAGLTYSWVAEVVYNGATYHFEQEATDETVEAEDASGVYWTYAGIVEILGQRNLSLASNLDNETTEQTLSRIIADGTIADAYTNFRAQGSKPFPTDDLDADGNIPSDYAHYTLVQFATNLYAAYQLVRHRVWTASDVAATNQAAIDLKGEADDLYTQLFGTIETHDPSKPKPGTFQSVAITFDPNDDCDEFSSCG